MATADLKQVRLIARSAREWKGQLSKTGVKLRIQRHYRQFQDHAPELREHEADAVGMGLSYIKVL